MLRAVKRGAGLWIGLTAFVLTGAALMLLTPPARAQFSDSFNFLKAVKDRDGSKVMPLLDKPGTTIVNARDGAGGETALHIVVRGRDQTWTGFLIGKGANVDARDAGGETPLLAATRIGWVEGAETLLRGRARINLANTRGETPLIVAVQTRNPAMVRLLLGYGADPQQTDNAAGMSARDYARRDARAAAILKMLDETKPAAKATMGPTR